ncbi:YitT family protein [Solitalea sp. MAHUQ-68]|uniref:YitT family protein n=1 Tax=Solitalea agri TaxID=2953739 RepID=A0A9X2JAQ1_9SPHI|nr:YitT family protein [Solitalea agri]MCO4291667.1 YitT family protein [Solitalea agri]
MSNKSKTIHRLNVRTNITAAILSVLGVFSAAFGLKSFLIPNGFIDGGVTGISLLINHVTHIPFSILIFTLNIPFIFLGYKQIGKKFALWTLAAITGLAIVVSTIDFQVVTSDKLLISIFGGFFLGGGIGLAVRGGAVIDGTEILAVYITRKSVFTIGDTILIINILIFTVAAFLLGIEAAMYSILTYLSASKTVDFIIQGIEEYTGVTIISIKSHQIKESIINNLGRGVTIYKGERGFGSGVYQNKEIDIVFTVITRLEVSKLRSEIEKIDPRAFVIMHSINETKGGIIKRRPLH